MSNNDISRRNNSLRLNGFDYCSAGAYFITLCCADRRCLFGCIVDGSLDPSMLGQLVQHHIARLPERWNFLTVDSSVVMPNHVHLILFINQYEWDSQVIKRSFRKAEVKPISRIVGCFKAGVSRQYARMTGVSQPVWQRGFYDHVIRDEVGLTKIREYIADNPRKWDLDRENDQRLGDDHFYAWLSETGR